MCSACRRQQPAHAERWLNVSFWPTWLAPWRWSRWSPWSRWSRFGGFGSLEVKLPAADPRWQENLCQFPFLRQPTIAGDERLRQLVLAFLARKEFTGAHGLVVTDAVALAIASQACLPLLHMAPETGALPGKVLDAYDDFVTIVVHPGDMLARRVDRDPAGVVHAYNEPMRGEAMEGGPITLSWQAVAEAGQEAHDGLNLVIHEFAHKLDMRNGVANGCPPMRSADQQHWMRVMNAAFERFGEQVIRAERFGEPAPWMDAYAASSPAEFFAVGCEAYFVNPTRFGQEHPDITALFDHFFSPDRRTS